MIRSQTERIKLLRPEAGCALMSKANGGGGLSLKAEKEYGKSES